MRASGVPSWAEFSGKVLFGTDYPLNLYPKSGDEPGWRGILAEVEAAGLTAGEKAGLLAGAAAGLLGL